MRVEHRADGPVRLDREAFDELARAVRGGMPAGEPVAGLLGSGAVDAALPALRDPWCHLGLRVAGPRLVQEHEGWAAPEAVALLLAVHDDVLALTAFAPALLAAMLARVVRLGPRRNAEREPRSLAPDVVADLFHPDQLRRTSALAEAGAGWAWQLGVEWAGEGTSSVGMTVVDGDRGPHLVDGDLLRPVTPTWVWRRLTTALPTDSELGARAAARP